MCANGAVDVLDQIVLDDSILLDPLPSTSMLLATPLVARDLSIHPPAYNDPYRTSSLIVTGNQNA